MGGRGGVDGELVEDEGVEGMLGGRGERGVGRRGVGGWEGG